MLPSDILTLWQRDRQLLDADANAEAIGQVETRILETPATTPAEIRIKLLLALDHMHGQPGWLEAAVRANDLAPVYARETELNIDSRFIIGAVRALERMAA